jgi:hypothetical protein
MLKGLALDHFVYNIILDIRTAGVFTVKEP